jgi:Na+-translocating ferredoxin:NAD+ oxidoreductase RnfG subunit
LKPNINLFFRTKNQERKSKDKIAEQEPGRIKALITVTVPDDGEQENNKRTSETLVCSLLKRLGSEEQWYHADKSEKALAKAIITTVHQGFDRNM